MAKIWIPDDNNILLAVIGRSLRRAGHTIISCSSPEFALARPSQIRKGDNVLIVDLTTAENRELALMLKIRIPRLKVLFIAERSMQLGQQNCHGLVQAIAPGERNFLRKPFTGNELVMKLDDLLAGQTEELTRAAGAA
jgi:DNA-binding NtrC family response regulator